MRRLQRASHPWVFIALTLLLLPHGGIAFGASEAAGGIVQGKVVGPGNAAIPGARVILLNMATHARQATWSNGTGQFEFHGVAPGQYRVIVIMVGFGPAFLGPVEVAQGKSVTVDATLAMAKPGQGPMFGGSRRGNGKRTGQPPAGGARSGQFSPPTMMNQGSSGASGGLRFFNNAGGTDATQPESGSGQGLENSAGASNSFLLTGNVVDATAPPMRGGRRGFMFFNFGGGGSPFGGPQGAPFGGGGGPMLFFGGFRPPGVNQYHGSIMDLYTNSALDARPYPLNSISQPRQASYREIVGFSLGGPLNIPKIYKGGEKTSFFFNFNLTRGNTPQNDLATVPTVAERQGNFSGIPSVIYQPSTTPGPRTPFPNNTINTALDSAALGLLPYIPKPNLTGEVQNYHAQFSQPLAMQMFMGRIDRQISKRDNFSVMYFYNSSNQDGYTSFPAITSSTTTRMQNVSLTETHNFSPRTVNTLMANFNRARTDLTNPYSFNQNIAATVGMSGVSQNPRDWGLPTLGFTNFSGLSDAAPSLDRNQTFSFNEFLMKSVGKHDLQFGGGYTRIELNSLTNPNAEGTFGFTGYSTSDFTSAGTPVNGTGNDFADFLLGLPQTTSERFGIPANYLRSSRFDLYAQDDWRVANHLTLNFGGRWEYAGPFTEKYGHLSDLALGTDFSVIGTQTGQNPDGLPTSLLRGRKDNFAPRVGLAYRPWLTHSLVLRAGYGLFYDESIYQNLVMDLINQAPFATTSTLTTSPTQVLTLEKGFPTTSSTAARNTFAVDPNFLTPYAQSWNFSLEQDLSPTYILSIAYIGTRGDHLNLLLVPNTGTLQAQPFEYETSGATSLYNGVRVSLRHFSRHNFMFFLNYTYSKSEDNAASVGGATSARGFFFFGGPGGLGAGSAISGGASPLPPVQNPNDLGAEWALSGFNATHTLQAFTRYQLPFGSGARYFSHGKLAPLFSSWSIADQTSFNSGYPYTAYVGGNASNNVNGLAPFGGLRANVTSVPVKLASPSTLEYFNTQAFSVPPAGEFGNAARNTIPGPPSLTFNMSLNRIVVISREKNMRMNFRLATSNTFNTVNYSGLSTIVNSSTFGRVTGVGSMRTVTLSARFFF